MSLILDALNRSRQDAQPMPGLATQHLADNAGQGTSWLQWLLVVALAAAVLVIGWLLFDRALQPVVQEDDANAVSVAPSEPSPLQRAAPGSSGVASDRPAEEPAAVGVVSAPPVAVAPVAPSPAIRQPAVPLAAKPEPAPADPGVAALYQEQRREEVAPDTPPPAQKQRTAAQPASREPLAASREEEVIDIDALVARAQEELEDAKLQEHEVPLLASLSQQTKDAIPTLMYQRHDYSGDPARSSVVINGKALHPGNSVGGVKVEEILPDSVVLSFQGHRFRLRALNSWVNL